MTHKEFMDLAIEKARAGMRRNVGGPFGATIVDEKGNVVAVANNCVLQDKDPTAHAEVTAIREAAKKLGTHDLSGCTIYATGYPCPMCLGAIVWANIQTCYYGATPQDAEEIGFRDEFIYRFIRKDCKEDGVLALNNQSREECVSLFREYHETQKQTY